MEKGPKYEEFFIQLMIDKAKCCLHVSIVIYDDYPASKPVFKVLHPVNHRSLDVN